MPLDIKGIGMTSQRTRDRLAKTLVEMGIKSEEKHPDTFLLTKH